MIKSFDQIIDKREEVLDFDTILATEGMAEDAILKPMPKEEIRQMIKNSKEWSKAHNLSALDVLNNYDEFKLWNEGNLYNYQEAPQFNSSDFQIEKFPTSAIDVELEIPKHIADIHQTRETRIKNQTDLIKKEVDFSKLGGYDDISFQLIDTIAQENPLNFSDKDFAKLKRERDIRAWMNWFDNSPDKTRLALFGAFNFSNLFNVNEYLDRKGLNPFSRGAYSTFLEASYRYMAQSKLDLENLTAQIVSGVPKIALEFAAIPDIASKIKWLKKAPKAIKLAIATSTRFAGRATLQAPYEGETIGDRLKNIGIDSAIGAGVGVSGAFPVYARLPITTAGFAGLTYLQTGDRELALEAAITILGFEALGLIQKAGRFSQQRLRNRFASDAVKAARKHNPDLYKLSNREVADVLWKHAENARQVLIDKDLSHQKARTEVREAWNQKQKGDERAWRKVMEKYTMQKLEVPKPKPPKAKKPSHAELKKAAKPKVAEKPISRIEAKALMKKGYHLSEIASMKPQEARAKIKELADELDLPENKELDNFLNHISDPKNPAGFALIPIPESLQEATQKAGQKAVGVAKEIDEHINNLRFYPKAPPELRNAVRIDLIGALTKARRNVYDTAQKIMWGKLGKEDIQKSVEIIFAKDQLSRTKLNKGNPDIPLKEAQKILDNALKTASPEAITAADRFKTIHDNYTQKLISRGILDKDQIIEDHVRHFVEDYTPEWAPYPSIPSMLKRPFRGYAKKAVGTTKAYRQDKEAILDSLMEMEHHNLIEDFIKTQVANYDIKPTLTKEQKRELFGITKTGRAKVPKPGRIYIHEGKRYRGYTPDIPFSRAIYITSGGEAALGSYKNVALIPEETYNLFRNFSQRGSWAMAKLNRATSYWKSMAILSHFTGFTVNNMIGDTWISMIQHPKPNELLQEYQTAINYLLQESKEKSDYLKELEDFIVKHDIKQTFAKAELARGKKSKNPISWLLRATYIFSDKRESVNRIAYASSLLKAMKAGDGKKMIEAHDWIDTEKLSEEDALGKIAREALTDYGSVSKPFRRYISGGIAPFGTWYLKTSLRMWKWTKKHWAKGLAVFMSLPIVSAIWNRRSREISELEERLPDHIRNRVHFVLGENDDGTVRVLSLQLPQDVLIGTKIFSVVTDYASRVISGEMKPKEAAVKTLKQWGIGEYRGVTYLITPWIRLYNGLKTGKDPYDRTNVYRREYNEMTWDERAKDTAAYILKVSVPFLGYTMQNYEKGLPVDVGLKKALDKLAGKGGFGIYDMNKKGQVVWKIQGKKVVIDWETVHDIHRGKARELKWLGQLEDDYVASGKGPLEFLQSRKARESMLKIFNVYAKKLPELKNIKSEDKKIRIVIASLGERLTNRVLTPRIVDKWYQVKISRAKTKAEKKRLGEEKEKLQSIRIIEALKAQPKTDREIELIKKIQEAD